MRIGVLGLAWLAAAALAGPSAEAQGLAEPPDLVVPAGRGFVLGHRHEGLQNTPWHYHPPRYDCLPPYCLPSYHRHRERAVAVIALPVAVVLDRLTHLDYGDFGAVLLNGANYEIDARNRYGRPVRLIVSAETGLLRAQHVLSTFE